MNKRNFLRLLCGILAIIILSGVAFVMNVAGADLDVTPAHAKNYTLNVGDTKYLYLDADDPVLSAAWISTAPFDVEITEQNSVYCQIKVKNYVSKATIQCNYTCQKYDELNNRIYVVQMAAFFNITVNEPDEEPSTGGSSGGNSNTPVNSFSTIGSAITGYSGSASDITIPQEVSGVTINKVTGLGGATTLKSITIPGGITEIDSSGFYNCSNLENLYVSSDNPNYSSVDGVLYNKDQTELVCYPPGRMVESFDIPDGVESIARCAFYKCNKLVTVTFPSSLRSIGDNAFVDCTYIKNIVLPEGITNIESWTFGNCYRLESVVLPKSVQSIGICAFRDCFRMKSITISEGVESIGEKAFYDCYGLESIVLPEGLTEICESAFDGCSILRSIVIPKSVTTIEHKAFYCSELEDVYYTGTQEQWEAITIGTYNVRLQEANIHYNYVVPQKPSVTFLVGDTNSDGRVNVKDATEIQKAVAGLLTLDKLEELAADVDSSTKVNVKDATAIQKWVAGMETGFAIGKEKTA